jgi:hypothetical protein
MNQKLNTKPLKQTLKPAAPKYILLTISGLMWFGVGIFLNTYVYSWLSPNFHVMNLIFIGSGVVLSIAIHKFGFSKVANKNLKRIDLMPNRPCIFSFMSWKSYVLVMIMISFGITLRLSPIPKNYLSIIYTGIGLALMLSSLKYFKMALKLFSRKENNLAH